MAEGDNPLLLGMILGIVPLNTPWPIEDCNRTMETIETTLPKTC